VGFGVAAHDAASAAGWRTLQGIGLAGTYMPGLKALTDLVPARLQSRTIAFYTSCFGIGSAMSFYLAGALTNAFGWRWAFVLAGGGPLLALVVIAVALPPVPPSRQAVTGRLWDFRPVLRNRAALGYMLAYAAHNVELFAFRTWVVAFLVYVLARHGQDAPPLGLEVTTIGALLNLASLPASVTGNEVAERLGRRRTLAVVMLASAGLASVLGFSAAWSVWAVLGLLVVYSFTVMADSATITAGAVAAARTHQRGTTMAVHSVLGFSGAAVGPLLFGAVLDVAGGGASLRGWGAAFLSMGVVVALGPLAVWSRRGRQS
jgi:MFS family permease